MSRLGVRPFDRYGFRRPVAASLSVLCGLLCAVTLLTACGSSKHDAASTSSGTAAASGAPTTDAATIAAVTQAYTTLFNGTAPLDQRLAYLQNSSAFVAALSAQSTNPIIKETSATVSQVRLTSPTQASVLFTVALSGTPLLKDQNGIAVKIGDGWKVAAGSLCALLTLEGQAATVCSQVATTALPS
jgi:hypothetical protein